MRLALAVILALAAGCSLKSDPIPPAAFAEAAALCKPFQGMATAEIDIVGWTSTKSTAYRVQSHCIGGQLVTHTITVNDAGEVQ